MGSWGTGIFADDFASDIRADWREALEDGLAPEAATSALIAKYHARELGRDDDGATFWIALAAAQTLTGRLQPEVKQRALEVIAAGGDVDRFDVDAVRMGRKRAAALADLATALRGPQRQPTVIRRPRPRQSPVAIGDVVLVRGGSARRDACFLVIGITDAWPRGSTAPEMAALRWTESRPPGLDEARALPLVRRTDGRIAVFMVHGPSRGPSALENFATIVASGVARDDLPDPGSPECSYTITHWRGLSDIVASDWWATALDNDHAATGPSDRTATG